MEARVAGDEQAKNRAIREALAEISNDRYRQLHGEAVEAYVSERSFEADGEKRVASMSVREIEARVESLRASG